MPSKYSFTPDVPEKSCKARASYLRTHFKNMFETANAIKGMKLEKAFQYLGQVGEHQRCIPFRRYNRGLGRTGQAKEFGVTKGRWPTKSIKFLTTLLENAKSNAVAKNLNVDALIVKHISVQQAPKIRRRMYRAHGRITPFMASPCHIEMILSEQGAAVPKTEKVLKPKVSAAIH